ncbi:MAG: site-specific integrase [Planctomycetaceae bacterium]
MPIEVKVREWGRKNWYMTWLDPVTGQWVGRSTRTANYEKAVLVAAKKQDELNAAEQKPDGLTDWEAFVSDYEDSHLSTLAKGSRDRATGVLETFKNHVNPKNLRVITGQVLREYFSWLRKNGREEETVKLHRRTMRAAFQWAVDSGYLAELPAFPKSKRARQADPKSKGRPLTGKEFVSMLRKTREIVGPQAAKSWRRFQIGLWRSGLRLDEGLRLGWSPSCDLWIETDAGELPLLGIKAIGEKGRKNRLLPLTPDFARWILRTPTNQRVGTVFNLVKSRHHDKINKTHVSKQIAKIGEAAGVVVAETGKFASAHDFRRSFGLRWALKKISPFELQLLMRHSSVNTTQQYYVSIEAQQFAARLWARED